MAVNTDVLLDKLYNLRSSDSEILKEMDSQKEAAEQTKERTTEEKSKLQSEIAKLKRQREELEAQGEELKKVLQGINRKDYDTVLSRLEIDFNPSDILDKIEKNLPKTIEKVEKDTKASEAELVSVEEEMNTAITTIEEIGLRKDAALANQAKLNEYFEMALKGHINITRDSITSLLQEFGFDETEQRETAKLLMFPEDALFAYDENLKHYKKKKNDVEDEVEEPKVIEEVKTEKNEAKEEVEPEIEEEKEVEAVIEPVIKEDEENEINIKTDEEETNKESRKEDVIDFLSANNIDYLDYTADEIEDLIANFDAKVVQENIDYMKEHQLDMDIFVNHMKMMYDKELQSKMELLLSVGKETLDIYLNPSVLAKYTFDELNKSIETMKSNGMNPKEIPLMAY